MSEEALAEAPRPKARATAKVSTAGQANGTMIEQHRRTVESILNPETVTINGVRALAVCKPRKLTKLEAMDIADLFPEVDPGVLPVGPFVMVQIRRAPSKSASGLIEFIPETQEQVKWNEMTGRVFALGPLAYRNPNDFKEYAEGDWCVPGDFVRLPKYGGDRIEVEVPGQDPALFVMIKDREVFAQIHGNPLNYKVNL